MKRWILAGLLAAVAVTTASAQEKPAPQDKTAATALQTTMAKRQPVKVQFVLARYQGDKRVSNMPYTLGVLADGPRTSMRMGIAVPIVVRSETATANYQYRDVGTNIDCSVSDLSNGQYQLVVTISDSSIHTDAGEKDTRIVRDVPMFRTFNATFNMILRDGQTMQYASVTDPVSGDVMKVDVTLNLAK